MKNFFIAGILFTAVLFFAVPSVFAQTGSNNSNGGNTAPVTLQNPLNSQYSTIPLIVGALLNIIVQIALVLCGLYIIYAGFLYVRAQGNSEKLSDANKTMLHAVIGTAIVLSSDVILTVLQNFINSIKS